MTVVIKRVHCIETVTVYSDFFLFQYQDFYRVCCEAFRAEFLPLSIYQLLLPKGVLTLRVRTII